MRYRFQKREELIFGDIRDARLYFCKNYKGECAKCPVRGEDWNCIRYVIVNETEAAERMGMEAIEDDGCNPDWSEAGKQFYKSLLNPDENIEDAPTVNADTPTEEDKMEQNNIVTVHWWDGYIEEFETTEVRFGSDMLFMRLSDGKNRHIPLREVRWFGMSK